MKVLFSEITDIRNPLILPWLDLYELAFPPAERSPTTSHFDDLITPNPLATEKKHRLAALTEDGQFAGMARYSYIPDSLIYLIYLAVVPQMRSSGIGAQLFEEVRRRSHESYPHVKLMAWEVERPENAPTSEEYNTASRRIEFYRRAGAKRLYGVDHFIQNRPDLPQVPMYIMVASLQGSSLDEIPQTEILNILKRHFEFRYTASEFKIA